MTSQSIDFCLQDATFVPKSHSVSQIARIVVGHDDGSRTYVDELHRKLVLATSMVGNNQEESEMAKYLEDDSEDE